jgi:predicted phage terminase large subunit-like protein
MKLKVKTKQTDQPIDSPQSSIQPALSRATIRAELARQNFYEFFRQAWHVLEPATPFVDGIHVHAICEHLQAVTEGRIRNLIINVPPGHAKSLLTSVAFPAWVWIEHPETRWLYASYNTELATRDSLRCKRLITSSWYQKRWGDHYQLRADQNAKSRFENSASGYRIVVSMGAGTGERGDYVVVDDPHSVTQAESDQVRKNAVEWWNGSMATRLNDPRSGHKIVIQQRLHEADLTGDLLNKGGYELLCLPAEFEPERRCSTSIGWTDPRQEPGELLWPERFGREELDSNKLSMGSYRYAGQYQQRPAPAEGGIFKRIWWRFWQPAHQNLPAVEVRASTGQMVSVQAVPVPSEFEQEIQSWDLSFKNLDTNDPVAGQVWGAKGADRYLLDQVCKRLDMPQTVDAIRTLSDRWPDAALKLIEDKANGPAVIATLKHEIPGLVAVNPEGSKHARAAAVSPQIEAGNVYLPHPLIAPWVEELLEECVAFPNGRHDDQVDAMTQALIRLRGLSYAVYPVPESEIAVEPFEIPDTWPRAFAMDCRWSATGALWGALDPASGILYVYSEHAQRNTDPALQAQGILARGEWIPGVLDHHAHGRTPADAFHVLYSYQKMGLNLTAASDREQSAISETVEKMRSGRFKVFRTLERFFAEYRIYRRDNRGEIIREHDLLMTCLRYLAISGRSRMCTKPRKEIEYASTSAPPSGYGAWMR